VKKICKYPIWIGSRDVSLLNRFSIAKRQHLLQKLELQAMAICSVWPQFGHSLVKYPSHSPHCNILSILWRATGLTRSPCSSQKLSRLLWDLRMDLTDMPVMVSMVASVFVIKLTCYHRDYRFNLKKFYVYFPVAGSGAKRLISTSFIYFLVCQYTDRIQ